MAQENLYARQLNRLLNVEGQAYLQTLDKAIAKLVNQDMTVALLQGVETYFADILQHQYSGLREMGTVLEMAQQRLQDEGDVELAQCLSQLPELSDVIEAMLSLSSVGETIVNPIFSQTDAIGTVMRKKLASSYFRLELRIQARMKCHHQCYSQDF